MIHTNNWFSKTLFFNIILLLILFTIRCASPGAISGGPKDEEPPVLVKSVPKDYATNFKGKKIRIDFDEFIQLKDVSQQFNVSPPLKKKPKVWLKNKSVVVEYSDTLKDSTTYTLSFGNSIVDNNEGNVLANFEFVFSTGAFIDSLGIRGGIVDAFSLNPDKDPLLLMLYSNLADSAPFKEVPLFTGRSDKDGNFAINNVKPGTYRLYGIKDKNFNYKYDPGSEPIAFFDTLVQLDTFKIGQQNALLKLTQPDSLLSDTIKGKKLNDTSKIAMVPDSMEIRQIKNSLHIDLRTFIEKNKKQYLKDYSRKNRRYLNMVFNRPLKDDSLLLTPIYYDAKDWSLFEFDTNHDSLNIWLTDTNLIKSDTLRMKIEYIGDTAWITDTLNFKYITEETTGKKPKKVVEEKMKISFNSPSPLEQKKPVLIETQYPISKTDISKIQLTKKVDTVEVPVKFVLKSDSNFMRCYSINAAFEEKEAYNLTFLPGSFENIYNLTSDTIKSMVSVQKADYYGTFYLTLSGFRYPLIVQLIEKNEVAFEKYVQLDGKVVFDMLPPTEYTLKIIFDNDGDKKYTDGDLLKHRQPEKVMFYKDLIKMRSNWEMEVNWIMQ
jgi:hypothetical protein